MFHRHGLKHIMIGWMSRIFTSFQQSFSHIAGVGMGGGYKNNERLCPNGTLFATEKISAGLEPVATKSACQRLTC